MDKLYNFCTEKWNNQCDGSTQFLSSVINLKFYIVEKQLATYKRMCLKVYYIAYARPDCLWDICVRGSFTRMFRDEGLKNSIGIVIIIRCTNDIDVKQYNSRRTLRYKRIWDSQQRLNNIILANYQGKLEYHDEYNLQLKPIHFLLTRIRIYYSQCLWSGTYTTL